MILYAIPWNCNSNSRFFVPFAKSWDFVFGLLKAKKNGKNIFPGCAFISVMKSLNFNSNSMSFHWNSMGSFVAWQRVCVSSTSIIDILNTYLNTEQATGATIWEGFFDRDDTQMAPQLHHNSKICLKTLKWYTLISQYISCKVLWIYTLRLKMV